MSHCRAALRLDDGTIMFAEYDGATDRVCSPAYKTNEEVTATWRAAKNPKCDCSKSDCEMFEEYGRGIYVKAQICLLHGSIVHGDIYEDCNRRSSDGSIWGHEILGSEYEEEE